MRRKLSILLLSITAATAMGQVKPVEVKRFTDSYQYDNGYTSRFRVDEEHVIPSSQTMNGKTFIWQEKGYSHEEKYDVETDPATGDTLRYYIRSVTDSACVCIYDSKLEEAYSFMRDGSWDYHNGLEIFRISATACGARRVFGYTQTLFNDDEKWEWIVREGDRDDGCAIVMQEGGKELMRFPSLDCCVQFVEDDGETTYFVGQDGDDTVFWQLDKNTSSVSAAPNVPVGLRSMFSLSGQRLSARPRSGVYIDGGRKRVAR